MLWTFLVLIFGLGGCKDDIKNVTEALPFDPAKPVVVSDFSPKAGGMGQRLVIYGQNFGNDPTKINVLIGGKQAKVISAVGESLYCLVPRQAFNGDIEVRVGDPNKQTIGK